MEAGTRDFASPEESEASPLAEALFTLGDVTGVFFGRDFISVTAAPGVYWHALKSDVLGILLDHFAGGMPLSGEWYVSNDDGSALSFNDARAAVAVNPTKIWQGRIGPYPLPKTLSPLVVVTVWGGEKDLWDCGPPLGLCSDYRPSTQAGANYFASLPNVVHVACSSTHGHMWPQINMQAFNAWALKTMASHPKGSDAKSFKLTQPPEGYSCKLGAYTDHY